MDHKKFLRLFLSCEQDLRAYLLGLCGDLAVAEEIFQDASVVLWEKFADYDESRPFLPWALGVARLQFLKWRQKLARSRLYFSGDTLELLAETAAEMPPDDNDEIVKLRECLRELEPGQKHLLELRYAESLAVDEIASRLNRSFASVKMTLQRLRVILQKCVERKLRLSE
jgi:RNA polymerase sigma-70 factor (ECF subfamily)